MTPELRAARDRLANFADPGFPMPALELPDELGPVAVAEARRLVDRAVRGIRESLAPDLRAVLADYDRLKLYEDADRAAAQRVRAEFDAGRAAYPTGQCEDCSCCTAAGCRMGLGSTCPADRLGDSVCPCTGELPRDRNDRRRLRAALLVDRARQRRRAVDPAVLPLDRP